MIRLLMKVIVGLLALIGLTAVVEKMKKMNPQPAVKPHKH